jgi:5-carboxymethyl-2-hydroxymuconate isomerase
MRLVHHAELDAPIAAVAGGRVTPLAERLGLETVDELIAAGPAAWDEAEAAAADGTEQPDLDPGLVLAPLRRPGKILCVGLNYHDHARESGQSPPVAPLLFAKYNNALAGPRSPLSWPAAVTSQVDWEVELAAVVGRRLRNAGREEALAGVFGYTVANDVSARDVQFADGQWTRGKTLDGFCPIGPAIVTAAELGDPGALALRARVNGQVMQESSTANMIFGVAEILSFFSQSMTLDPGDLVLTGTPWGVGAFRSPPVFLQAGDEVEVEIEGIGVLSNPVDGPLNDQVVSAP